MIKKKMEQESITGKCKYLELEESLRKKRGFERVRIKELPEYTFND